MIELARVLSRVRSEATIVFVAFAGEEQGLFGSDHFAELAQEHGWNIQGVLNMDIIGSPNGGNGVRDPRAIRLFSEGVPTAATPEEIARRQSLGGENDSVSRQLARFVKETGENDATGMRVNLIWRRDRFLRGGDQISFLERGWPAVRFTEPNEDFDHQHQDVRVEDGEQIGDLPEFVDFAYLARVTRVVGSSLAALARAPRAPRERDDRRRAALATTRSCAGRRTPSRTSWATRSSGAIRRRRCGRTRARSATSSTATIPNLNKDDVQLGVRAIDRDGNRSPVAFAIPRDLMLVEHRGRAPVVDPSAYVAPTAVLCGDVTVGPGRARAVRRGRDRRGRRVAIGARCVVMEQALVRGRAATPVRLGDDVLVGPHAHVNGAEVGDGCFLATGCSLFPGARLGRDVEVRINGVVHVNTRLADGATVPIGWVAVGDPAQILPPGDHEAIWAIQEGLDFPGTVYGLPRDAPAGERMARQAAWFGAHRDDRVLG